MSKITIPNYKGKGYFARQRAFFKDPLGFTVKQSQELGDFFYSYMLFKHIFFTANPEVAQHFLQTNQKNYRKSPAYDQLKLALGNGLVTSEGEFWKKQRRLAQPAFHKKKLETLFLKMVGVTENYLQKLKRDCQKQSERNIALEMMTVTADIVLKCLFSSENENDQQQLYRTMSSSQEYIMQCIHKPLSIPWSFVNGRRRKFFQDLKVFDDVIQEMVDERRKGTDLPMDLLTMLLEASDEDTGEGMTDRQVRDEAITIFAAGHETSANALSWTLYLLTQHSEVLQKLRAEVDQVLGARSPSFSDVRALQYTLQVIEEGMRLYPPAWAVGREAIAEDEIKGQKIQAKALAFISVYALHRHPDLWPNPDKFDPDRFAPEKVKARSRWTYLPFGAGPRMCIGNNFALMEMQLVLALFVRHFDFTLLPDPPVEMQPLVTLKPRHGIKMIIKERQS